MMVTINTDELIGYILRKTGDEYHLDYEEVQAVLDSELEFLKSKGLTEEREDASVYIGDTCLNKEIISLDVNGVGSFHNTGLEVITLGDDGSELTYHSPYSLIKRKLYNKLSEAIVNDIFCNFKLTYSDTTSISGILRFTSVSLSEITMDVSVHIKEKIV